MGYVGNITGVLSKIMFYLLRDGCIYMDYMGVSKNQGPSYGFL